MAKPYLPNMPMIQQIGFNPKTGLPEPFGKKAGMECEIKKQLRILDEQNAVNRYTWYNLPSGLTGQLLERILYYRGQAMFFYMETNGRFYFLPYELSGSIDVYGRYLGTTPLQFAGGTIVNEKGKEKPWINGLIKHPVYEMPAELDEKIFLDGCVILRDYTNQISENIIPRQLLQDPLLGIMSEAIPMARTSLIASSGVRGVRVQDQDQAFSVEEASKGIQEAALTGKPLVPIVGSTEFQDLTNGSALKSEEYMLYLQALDNYRLSLYGLDTGGLFQKKSHMLEAEQSVNAGQDRKSVV